MLTDSNKYEPINEKIIAAQEEIDLLKLRNNQLVTELRERMKSQQKLEKEAYRARTDVKDLQDNLQSEKITATLRKLELETDKRTLQKTIDTLVKELETLRVNIAIHEEQHIKSELEKKRLVLLHLPGTTIRIDKDTS